MVVVQFRKDSPATTSVILAMGVSNMAKNKHAIVKTLPAVETLGPADVIAPIKSIFNENEMTVKDIITADQIYHVSGNGYAPEGQINKSTSCYR